VADWPFVGRQAEQDRVSFLLRARPPISVVLAGPQGVGKTRLAQATREWAAAQGFQVRHAAASSATTSIPFGALAALLPVLRDLPDTPQATFQAAADHLLGEAGDGKLLISIDDAHHLDEASAGLLHHLTPSPVVSVLLTLRTDLPAPDAIQAIWRSGVAERLDLGPLDEAGVAAVLADALDGEVARGTLANLVRLSAGNPLYLRELVTGSLASGTLAQIDGLWHLRAPATTPRLIDIVEERLRGLEPAERKALELVATAGSLGYALLVDLVGEDAVEALEREGLLEVTQERRRRVAAAGHAVHADVVRDNLTTAQAGRLHGEIADVIEAVGARRRDDVLRVAVARLASGGEVSAPLMAEAARRALVAHYLALSERLVRIAIEAGAGLMAELDLATTLTLAGRQAEADRVFLAIDTSSMSDDLRALVAVQWSDCLFWGLDDYDRAQAAVAAAIEQVEDPDWHDQLVVARASFEMLVGHADIAAEALEPIWRAGTPRGIAASGLIAGGSLAVIGRGDEALDVVSRAWSARDEIDEGFGLVYEGMLVVAECLALTELGRFARAQELGLLGHAAAVGSGVVYGQAWIALTLARGTRFTSALGDTAKWAREAATCFDSLGIAPLRRWALYASGWASAQLGDRDEARGLCEEARSLDPGHVQLMEPDARRAEAALAVLEGDRGGAVRHLQDGAELAAKLGLVAMEMGVLHDLVRLDEADDVIERIEELAPLVDGALAAAIAAHARAAVTHNGTRLGEVADRFAAMGADLLAAEAAAQASGAHRNAMDRRAAQRWASRSAELVEGLGPVDTPALHLGGESAELTSREREIALLAARRIPSKEIAQRLTVSRRTVDNHLHRVYGKLGVMGRDELAEALGITPD
jgi:DNA-binding CsgD family transcriptional regulator/tetratricopeptide (TPR) repeat protein